MREMQTAEMMSHSAEANSHTYPTPLLGGGGGMVLARRAPPDGATSRVWSILAILSSSL